MMFRKYSLLTLLAIAFLSSTAIVASAQVGALSGHVNLKQADGTTVPLVGAVVEAFRTDIGGKYETKTDKKGEFRWAGVPYSGMYVIAASAPGAQPNFRVNVKPGQEIDYVLLLEPGDGKRLTFDEIKAMMKGGTSKSSGSAPAATENKDERAKRAEIEAKNREIMEKNKKVEDSNKIIEDKYKLGNTSLIAGETASRAAKYAEAEPLFTEAIKQYDEGIATDPQHPGVPTLMTYKAQALMDRGIGRYNHTVTSDAYKAAVKTGGTEAGAMLEPAKKDWKDAGETASKAVESFKTQTPPTDPAALANYNSSKYSALFVRTQALNKVVSKVDPTQVDAGVAAYDEYLAAETDAAKKTAGERDMAKMLFDANAYERAKPAYEKILAQNPDDVDALQNVGLILYNLGFIKEADGKKDEAKASYQEAANYLQRFVDKSPDGQLKTEAQDVLKNLKEQQNVQAEKVATPTKRRRP